MEHKTNNLKYYDDKWRWPVARNTNQPNENERQRMDNR